MADMHAPWTDTETDYGYSRIVDAKGDEICEVWDFGEKTLGARVALICAAPDLLSACEAGEKLMNDFIAEYLDLHTSDDAISGLKAEIAVINIFRAAIARAKETPCT